MLFTYEIYKKNLQIRLTPTKEFYKIFTTAPILIHDGYIFNKDKNLIIQTGFYEKSINNGIGYEIIQFYMNNFGKYINFTYSQNNQIPHWIFRFKITNKNLLLELL